MVEKTKNISQNVKNISNSHFSVHKQNFIGIQPSPEPYTEYPKVFILWPFKKKFIDS